MLDTLVCINSFDPLNPGGLTRYHSTTLPNHLWEKLATDLFELKGSTYILLVDCYSRFVEVQKMTSTTTASIIAFLKPMFAWYRIPATLISNNGPRFSSAEMQEFPELYGFYHITSLYYPQANGQAEWIITDREKPHEQCERPSYGIAKLSCNTFGMV